ncbi:MAG TPA: NlpC/P60 family protein [Verrucomicrobiae bacterium]|nr:NlpC/P60 family protein [Verrucomicrobiae bacterium]
MHRKFVVVVVLLGLQLLTGCAARAAGLSRMGYSIQVGAFADVKNAERLAARLQEKGLEAFYFRRENGVYAVRFGDFRTRDEAKREAQKLAKEKLIGEFFIALPLGGTLAASPGNEEPRREQKPPPPPKKQAAPEADMGAIAARTAERFVGIPYRWGGNTVVDGMDCSGFVRAVYNLCGVNIPRTSAEQFRTGRSIDREELRDGDLVFFGGGGEINHVGIYVGEGRFVHAPRRGDDIKVSRVGDGYFEKKFMGARRYFER